MIIIKGSIIGPFYIDKEGDRKMTLSFFIVELKCLLSALELKKNSTSFIEDLEIINRLEKELQYYQKFLNKEAKTLACDTCPYYGH